MKDARLVERALRESWPVPQALRKPLIQRLANIVQDPKASPREAVAAARALLAASRINLESTAVAGKLREIEEIAARLDELEKKVDELEQDQASSGASRGPAWTWNGRA
jgi:hypothetical protein